MTLSKRTILAGLLLLSPTILAVLLLGGYWLSKGEQANEAAREAPVHNAVTIAVKNGRTTLTVDEKSQGQSGIAEQPVAAGSSAEGPIVYGTVVDLQPLVDLTGRYASAIAELAAAKSELYTVRAELGRVTTLYNDEQNLSLKALGAARAADATAVAKFSVAEAAVTSIVTTTRQQFGTSIAGWLSSPPSSELASLLSHREVMVRIALPSQPKLVPKTLTLYGDSESPVEARLVSVSTQTDPNVQGQAYIYRVASSLATGARVTGHVSTEAKPSLRIPADSIVWYGGQPWAYVRTAPTNFERRAVDQNVQRNGDFLVPTGFKAGEQVVVRGAQLLLSEESRALLSKD